MNDSTIIFAKIKTLDDLEGEEWKSIRGSKHYFVSNLGRVKSNNKHCMKILEQKKNDYGYWRVCLSLEVGNPRYYLTSRLVAEAFKPEDAGEDKEVHHLKGKDCNTSESLVWLSKEEHSEEHERIRQQKKVEADGKK